MGKVIACDISAGVLACADAVNHASNIEYRTITKGRIPAEDSSIDLIYSFAVFQHVTDEVMLSILREFKRVMKPSGTAVCHVIVEGVGWRSEAEWRADKSLKGRVKWELGLHCFLHPRERIQEMAESAGLRSATIANIAELGVNLAGDDIEREQLCVLMQ